MWKRYSLVFAVLAIFLVLPFKVFGQTAPKPVCVVLPFYPDEASARDYESRYISNRYARLLRELERYRVISPAEVERRLAGSNLLDSTEFCSEKKCALEIGNALDADYVIYGIIGHIGNMYSLDTTIVNIPKKEILNTTVTDIEGSRDDFAEKAPSRNITSLLILSRMPSEWQATRSTEVKEPELREKAMAPVPSDTLAAEKELQFGPRLGLGYSDDGIEVGIGFEVRHTNLSFKFLGNDIGFAGAFSYYIEPTGNSPYASLLAGYYWDDPHGIDEEGFLYGALAGYRINLKENIDICLGLGIGIVDWEQTEFPDRDDTDTILLGEFTLGYMF